MRQLVLLILVFTIFSVAAQRNEPFVNVDLNDTPVTLAINEISDLTGYHFAYNPDILENQTVSLHAENLPMSVALDRAFGSQFEYKLRGSYVILLPKSEQVISKEVISTVKGEIREEGTGKKLENVSIYEVHTLKPVLTDASGNYALDLMLPDEVAFIAISKANYEDTVIQVKKGENWSIALKRKTSEVASKTNDWLSKLNNKKVKTHAENVYLTEVKWIQLALTPGLSTNGFLTGQFTNKVSFNLIGGYHYALEGVELGGVLNMERSYVKGAQLSGGFNINSDFMKGVQMAGFSNLVLGDVDGLQMAGFSDHALYWGGAQMSGYANTSRNGHGLQASGFANWNAETYEGLQISGGFNYTKTLKGLQVGVVNVADSVSSGFMLGIVNWTRNGLHNFEVSYNDITPYNLSFKSGVKHFYTILSAGINPNNEQMWSYGMGFGSMHGFGKRFFWDMESTFHMIQPMNSPQIDGISSDTRIQMHLGIIAHQHFQLIGGPVLHFYHLKPNDPADLNFADLFGSNPLSENNTGYSIRKAWLCYELAVRF
jgi:hypothetical protein